MKKLCLVIAVFLTAMKVFADNQQTIFENTLTTEEAFAPWTVIDANSDQVSWKFNVDKQAAHYAYTYVVADDWLVSPAISIQEPGAYKLSYEYMGSVFGEMLDVFWGTQAEVTSLSHQLMDLGLIMEGDNYQTAEAIFTVSEAQDIFIGFHAKSDPDKFKILLRNVKLEKAQGIDLSLDAISTVESGYNMGLEDLTITVANNGLSDYSNVEVSYQLNDQTPMTEVIREIKAGTKMDYTFQQKADFTEVGTYTVLAKVALEGDELPLNNERSIEVRHKGPATIPYTTSFEDTDNVEDFQIWDLNEDPADDKNGKWSRNKNSFFAVFSRTGDYAMIYFYSKNNPGNDWFVLEPIQMKKGYYSLKFWYSSDHKETLAVYYGKEAKPEAMTNEIVRYDNFIEEKYKESANVIHIEEDGVYYFGFKSESTPNQNVLCIDDISITEIENLNPDLEIVDVKAPLNDGYVRAETSYDVAFSLTNHGILDMKGASVMIDIDDKNAYNEKVDVASQETKVLRYKDALAGLQPGKHNVKITIAHEYDEVITNNMLDIPFTLVKEPALMFDFEEGALPEGFLLKVEDTGTVNAGLKDVFPNNEAWALVGIGEHPFYGEWMFASASWLDGAQGADRWCILPKLHIGASDSYLIWMANSADSGHKFAESYEIMVSTTDTETANFEKVLGVEKENFTDNLATRGVDLSKYAGQDVYVAFRLTTKDGFFLAIDNVGFYGDVTLSTNTGIDSLEGSDYLEITDDRLVCHAENVEMIEVYGTNGKRLISVQHTASVDMQSLPKGVYIVRVVADGNTILQKISR